MIYGVLVFVAALILEAPLWLALVSGLVVGGIGWLTAPLRRRRRERLAAERAARRAALRAEKRAQIKDAVQRRTGVDVDVLGRAAQDAVQSAGSRVTERLRKRTDKRRPSPKPRRDDWLDLDNDYDAMRSQALTEEALRLNEQLRRQRRP